MRDDNKLLMQEIKGKIDRYGSFVIMQYMGLKANTANDFRREIGKMGGDVEIVSKRILVKAAAEAGIPLDLSTLNGHIGLVFLGQDPIKTTKTVFKFSQDREKVIQILGGRLEGRLYHGADVERFSQLPGEEVMRAQLLAVLEAPMSQTLGIVQAILSSVVYCLDNKSKETGSQESGS